MLGKRDICQNDPKKSSTEKKAEHIPSGYSLVTCCSFDKSKNELIYYRGKDCMEMFCEDLRYQPIKITNYEKKEIIPVTNEEKSLMKSKKFVIYVKKNLVVIKNTIKSEIIIITQRNLEEPLIIITI